MGYWEFLRARLERYAPYLCAVSAVAGMRARSVLSGFIALWIVVGLFTVLLSLFWLCGIGRREIRGKLPRLR